MLFYKREGAITIAERITFYKNFVKIDTVLLLQMLKTIGVDALVKPKKFILISSFFAFSKKVNLKERGERAIMRGKNKSSILAIVASVLPACGCMFT